MSFECQVQNVNVVLIFPTCVHEQTVLHGIPSPAFGDFWGLSPGYREAILHPSFHPFPPVSLFLPFAFILLIGFYVRYLCTVFLQTWSCRKTAHESMQIVVSWAVFPRPPERCNHGLWALFVDGPYLNFLGYDSWSSGRISAQSPSASRCFKHFRSTCWTCPSFLQVRLSSSFFPLKVLTTNSRRLSLCLCQLWWTLAMSPSPPGAQRVHEHLETFGTHLRLNQYCTYTAPVHLSSRSQEFEHVWAI